MVKLTEIDSTERLEFKRESMVIVVPVYGSYDEFVQCIHSVLKHTATDVPLLVADDGSTDTRIRMFLKDIDRSGEQERCIYYLRHPSNIGSAKNLNSVFKITKDADVVILNSDCVVASGWYESLGKAISSDSQIATVSTLTNSGSFLSVPNRNRPFPALPQEWSFKTAAAAVHENAPNLNAQIPTGIGHCLYIRRSAIDVVGDFDETFPPGYGEIVDFCQRCVLSGLKHVVADDVLVLHHGVTSVGNDEDKNQLQIEREAVISDRYQYYSDWARETADSSISPLARSIIAASIALNGISLTIDGSCLSTFVSGTSIYTLELISALSKISGVRLRVFVPNKLDDDARAALDKLSVELLQADTVDDSTERSHVVHRPYQLACPKDIKLLKKLGERIVLTQLDMIAYVNPGYYNSFKDWWNYRQLVRTGFMLADQVVFISQHAAETAKAEELLDPERAEVVYPGTDHSLSYAEVEPSKPKGLEPLNSNPFLLCLGTDFRHKNRRFALRLLESLRERHGWKGSLVFAGGHVLSGSSAGDEAEYLATRPELDSCVVDLAAVNGAEKAWLYRHATAVLYPSLYEGFGFLPFEAARAGIPCLFASHSSLEELLPSGLSLLTKWDADASARRVIEVLSDTDKRRDHIDELKAAAAQYTWDKTGLELSGLYKHTCSLPASNHAELRAEFSRQQAELEQQLIELRHRTQLDSYSHIDKALVGPEGVIPPDLRRALLGAWNRKWTRVFIYWPFMAIYRFVYLLKHRKSSRKLFNE